MIPKYYLEYYLHFDDLDFNCIRNKNSIIFISKNYKLPINMTEQLYDMKNSVLKYVLLELQLVITNTIYNVKLKRDYLNFYRIQECLLFTPKICLEFFNTLEKDPFMLIKLMEKILIKRKLHYNLACLMKGFSHSFVIYKVMLEFHSKYLVHVTLFFKDEFVEEDIGYIYTFVIELQTVDTRTKIIKRVIENYQERLKKQNKRKISDYEDEDYDTK